MDVVSALRQHSEAGAAIVDLLYGEMGSEVSKALIEFGKAAPPTATPQTDLRKRRMTAALSTVGAAAGAGGLALSGKKFGGAARAAYKAAPTLRKLPRLGHAISQGVKHEGGSAALFPLEVAGLGGEISATKILHGDTQQKKQQQPMAKSVDEVGIYAEISKVDTDKRQIFGWASVTSVNGQPVVDLQDDVLDLEEIEKAAYSFVQKSRIGGNMHQKEETGPIHVSDMIESMVITPEKKKAMGLPDEVPEGWWVGFKVNDDQTWADAKTGKLAGLSIHGSGRRVPV
jgi:hypothetical protein